MANSVRENILAEIETILKAIPGIGNVTRGKIDALDVQLFPAAFIVTGGDDATELFTGILDRTLAVLIFLWVKTEAEQPESLETFLAQIKAAMVADLTLNDTCHYLTEGPTHEPFPLNEEMSEAGIMVEYYVRYRTPLADPYTQAA